MLNLSPNETIVTQFPDRSVTLTSHRLSHRYHSLGSYHEQHIPLDEITSCETYHNTHPWILVLAVVAPIAAALLWPGSWLQGLAAGLTASLLCYGLYRLTHKNYVIVRSASTTMTINVRGLHHELVDNFIDRLSKSRAHSILQLDAQQAAG